jgi:ABC-2 type transport system ATP-binding protein
MRQRLGIAAALLGDPEILILDEPANGLDPDGIRWIRDFMRDFVRGGGRTILVSSHVLAEVAQVADDVVIIDKGRLVAQAPVAELTARASGAVRVRSPQADRFRELLGPQTTESNGTLLVQGRSAAEVGELAAANGIVLHELVEEAASLEDAFLELTRE